jgi:hypothetical protein
MGMKLKAIKLSDITIDGGTQQRVKINTEVVQEYAESMRCGHKFPPVTLFFDGAQYWLADGFHRYHASREAELLDVLAEIHDGTSRDARLFSAASNSAHGLRRSNDDKRQSVLVLLLDSEWSQWTNVDIAKHCHVSHTMVNKLRGEIAGNDGTEKAAKKPKKEKPAERETVSHPTPEANKDAGVNSELPKKEATEDENYDPKQDEIQEMQHAIADLGAENEALNDRLAVVNMDEDKLAVMEKITGLRSHIKTLEAELDAVKAMRDSLQIENAEMKKQLKAQRNQIAKLKKG